MKSVIQVLHLEDNLRDAELVQDNLTSGGLACEVLHVTSKEAFEEALEKRSFDVILCDYKMPGYDGLSALQYAQGKCPLVPVILLSGTIGDVEAVECLKVGATDYVLKQRLGRLVPSVRRALLEAEEHRERLRAEAALRDSESHFRSLFENMLHGCAHCRMLFENGQASDFVFLRVNSVFERLTGLSDLVGRRASEGMPGIREADPGLIEIFGRVSRSGVPERVEYYSAVLKQWYAIGTYSPAPDHFVAVIDMISERKQNEEQLRRLSQIIEQAPLSVIITNLAGTIEYANPKFCAVTGYPLDEVLGRNPRMIQSGETRPEVYRDLWHTISHGQVWIGELRNRKKNGELFLENVVIAPVTDQRGRVTHYVALKDDVTAQKRSEAEAAAMLKKEREVSELKTRFVAITSHEFRTPMAAAMGSAEALAKYFERIEPVKRQELLVRITTSLSRMSVMLDELLLLNRMDASRIEIRWASVDLVRFLGDLVEDVRLGDRDAHRFELHVPGDAMAFSTDINLMHHILSNVLSNAVRYSPAGTIIGVRLEADATHMRLIVEDQGIGVPAADCGRIFEPFERGSNVGNIEGSGLGLSIVKRMTEMLGGSIGVEPVEGGGSRFTMAFPHPPSPASPS